MPFLKNVPGLETIHRDFASKGVDVLILYKSLTHPGTNGFVEPATLDERLRHIEIARERLGTTIPFLCDSMSDDVKHALDTAPNAEFVVAADGTILRKRFWHDPAALRPFLEELVGPVDEPTAVADLDMVWDLPERRVQRGIVPALKDSRGGRPVRCRPLLDGDDGAPPYLKLVAEAQPELLEDGIGELYLGFHLDPIYGVHWNNPAGGLRWTLDAPGDGDFDPVDGATPRYEHEADADPREFLPELEATPGSRLVMTATYTVCDDAETFCIEVQQRFELTLEEDPDGGSRAGDWMTELVGNPMQFDANDDGRVDRGELPAERALIVLNHHDHNHDGAITPDEADLFHAMIGIEKGERGR
ncbi:MAG: hypothetical protein AAFU73_04855 [Planctomycetota bacterium]